MKKSTNTIDTIVMAAAFSAAVATNAFETFELRKISDTCYLNEKISHFKTTAEIKPTFSECYKNLEKISLPPELFNETYTNLARKIYHTNETDIKIPEAEIKNAWLNHELKLVLATELIKWLFALGSISTALKIMGDKEMQSYRPPSDDLEM